jgi:uncharacterized protein DUF6544
VTTIMMTAFGLLLVAHGLIHLLGVAKAFGVADLPQLTQPIAPPLGMLWLLGAMLFLASAVALFAWPRGWWMLAACGIAVSNAAIVPSWADAKAGAIANAIVLAAVVFGFFSLGPFSLRAEYERDVEGLLAPADVPEPVTGENLARLPAPVQQYLRGAGVIGRPRVHSFRVRMHGRIRNAPDARWMPFTAEQYNVVKPAVRLFYLNGSMMGLPFQGYHRYVAGDASMRVKAAGLVPLVTAAGPQMSQSETVTLFNDMCIMAPATLLDPAIEWHAVDDRTSRAWFTNAGHTIRAELLFDDSGELTNFVSDDRYQLSADGLLMRQVRWSTPLRAYRSFGPIRLASVGEGHWHQGAGEYAYLELTIDAVDYNVKKF